jgi:hypothetical protein
LVTRPKSGWERENSIIDRRVGFDGVHKRIDAAVGSDSGGTGVGEEWVDQCHAGAQIIADATKFDSLFGIGVDIGAGNLRTCASGGRDTNEGENGPREPVVAGVVSRLPAMREAFGSELGEVHVAAATQSDYGIWLPGAGTFEAMECGGQGGFWFATQIDQNFNTGLSERFSDLSNNSSAVENGV